MILEGEKERTKDKKKGEEDNDDQGYPQQGNGLSEKFIICKLVVTHRSRFENHPHIQRPRR